MNDSTLVTFFDGRGDVHSLLCAAEVTLLAVTSHVRDNYPTPFRIVAMTAFRVVSSVGAPLIVEVSV